MVGNGSGAVGYDSRTDGAIVDGFGTVGDGSGKVDDDRSRAANR